MQIEEIRFLLKDGREALLRSPRDEDIPGMLDYLRRSAGETDFLLRCPEDCGKYTAEGERKVFAEFNEAPYNCMLVCLVEGRLAGNSVIHFNAGIKTRHRAAVAIALLKDYWNQGIGTRMFQEMIRLAMAHPYATQMELGFAEGNERARALYEKMGFGIVGVHPNAIRLRDGTMLGEYLMIKPLDRG